MCSPDAPPEQLLLPAGDTQREREERQAAEEELVRADKHLSRVCVCDFSGLMFCIWRMSE